MSQNTITTYWYVDSMDPFMDYVTELADEEDPPLVNSISWGSIEQVWSVYMSVYMSIYECV